jgi:hypothetical protein
MNTSTNGKQQYINYSVLKGPKTKAIGNLNRLYVITDLNAKALRALGNDIYVTKRRTVPIQVVTRHGQTIETTKRRAKVKQMIESSLASDLYQNALISAVAIAENYLTSLMSQMLTAYPNKIGKDKKLDIKEILSVGEHTDIVAMLIEKEILSSMYKKPLEYLREVEKVVSISIPQEIIEKYAEIKASRDLCIHAQGVVNEAYVQKAGAKARGTRGDTIKVNKAYFDSSMVTLKDIVHTIFEEVLSVHGNSEKVSKAYKKI